MSDQIAYGLTEMVTRDRMAHYGYTPEQIKAAEDWPGHDASGCFFENMNWVCIDEDDKPNHPDRDELERTAEFVMWVLEHPGLVAVLADAEESRRTAWAVHAEHVETMNRLRLHDQAVAEERLGRVRVAVELAVQNVRAERGDHIAGLVEDSFAAHLARAEQLGQES